MSDFIFPIFLGSINSPTAKKTTKKTRIVYSLFKLESCFLSTGKHHKTSQKPYVSKHWSPFLREENIKHLSFNLVYVFLFFGGNGKPSEAPYLNNLSGNRPMFPSRSEINPFQVMILGSIWEKGFERKIDIVILKSWNRNVIVSPRTGVVLLPTQTMHYEG